MREARVAAVSRLLERHARAHFILRRQRARWDERIVARVEHEGRHADCAQPRLRRCAIPIVIRSREAMQRCSDDIVEVAHRAHAPDLRRVEESRKSLRDRQRLGLERRQEVVCIDAIQALADRDAGHGEVEWRGHCGSRRHHARRVAPGAPEPVQERAAAERHADRVQARCRGDALADRGQHGRDFRMVARVIRTRQPVGLAAATTEMRNDAQRVAARQCIEQRARIQRRRSAFEAVEQHDARRGRGRGRVEPVEVPEVAIGRLDALTPQRHVRSSQAVWPDRLRVTAGEPAWRAVGSDDRFGVRRVVAWHGRVASPARRHAH